MSTNAQFCFVLHENSGHYVKLAEMTHWLLIQVNNVLVVQDALPEEGKNNQHQKQHLPRFRNGTAKMWFRCLEKKTVTMHTFVCGPTITHTITQNTIKFPGYLQWRKKQCLGEKEKRIEN